MDKFYHSKKNKGLVGVEILLIGIIIIMGIVLVHGVNPINDSNTTSTDANNYTVDPNSLKYTRNGDKSLQLKTFGFIKVLPPSNNECNEDGQIQSNEPRVLWAISPDPGSNVGAGGKIKIWYNDESALPLGKAITHNVPVTTHLTNIPSLIDVDFKSQDNLPVYPAIFLTDITNNPSDKSGDVEHGGKPHPPDEVWGAWKISLPTGAPVIIPPNNLVLPQGADPFPANSNVKFGDSQLFTRPRETFNGAEAIWNVDSLGLTSGHSYRAEILIHDGDQNFGGDLGEACTTIQL